MKKLLLLGLLALSFTAGAQQHFCVNPFNGDKAKPNDPPALEVFVPAKPAGPAVIVLPGGSYSHRAYTHEGIDWAGYFNEKGICAAVLGYTLPAGQHEVPANDVYASIKYLRDNASRLGIDPEQIGVMGFSAGGHLASTVATHYKTPEERPAFQILMYPVISMDPAVTHKESRENLIGKNPSYDLERLYSNEYQVKSGDCPAYIALSEDDGAVPVANSLRYYQALTNQKVPAQIHIYPSGGHGYGFRDTFKYHNELLSTLSAWLDGTLTYKAPAI